MILNTADLKTMANLQESTVKMKIKVIASIGMFLFLFDEGPTLKTLDYEYPYWQYTNLFIFQFVSLLCLRSTFIHHVHSSANTIRIGSTPTFLYFDLPFIISLMNLNIFL